jgi:predicted nucleotidyltransferase
MARSTPEQALARLRVAAEDGRLASLCRDTGVGLLVAFGSAARGERQPADLDLAYARGQHDHQVDVLRLLDALVELTSTGAIDLLDLDRAGPVAASRALGRCLPLYESVPGRFAAEQVRAVVRFADTRWLREAQLAALAGR